MAGISSLYESYWKLTPKEAVALQNELRGNVRLEDDFGRIEKVAGVDMSIGRGWKEGRCAIVVLSFPEMRVIEFAKLSAPVGFPYVPGLLSFRELPLFLQVYDKLREEPDLLMLDGQGCAHPRRFGLACMAGLLVNKPAIGCAKSKLIGVYDEPGNEAGSVSPLFAPEGERIGDVVRTKTGIKPIFVSPGHRVGFETATRLALKCARGYRIPEPTRQAHLLVSS